ncbi:hypothetical protein KC953_00995 [Candidatus Saccharibacteria bacterium]|nr:hypothetical protein [Candidatus Saccharibacteria bacterium]
MNSNELPIDASELEIADLEPSQKQLLSLHEQIVACEIVPEPFDGIPENISMDDMSKMEVYSDGVEFDESLAPAALRKTLGGLVLWLSVFRNPQSNAIVRETITVVDPSAATDYDDMPSSTSFSLMKNSEDRYVLMIDGTIVAKKPEVERVATLLEESEAFDPFDEI